MSAPIRSIRSADAINQAIKFIKAGELIIIPTDTIYGIAALPTKPQTIKRLYEVRHRDPEPAMPFLLANSSYMSQLARVSPTATRLARFFWPGTLTLILPPGPNITADFRSLPIALRVPNYPFLDPLLEAAGGFLFTSGAIHSGYPPAITAQEAEKLFGDQVALILDGGNTPFGIPSTIVDCVQVPPVILRRGVIPEAKIQQTLNMGSTISPAP